MNEREKLGKEMLFIIKDGYLSNGSKGYVVHGSREILSNRLVDFILADRKRILGEIKDSLFKMTNNKYQPELNKALEIIKKYEGGV